MLCDIAGVKVVKPEIERKNLIRFLKRTLLNAFNAQVRVFDR